MVKITIILLAILLCACDTPRTPRECRGDKDDLQSLDDCLAHPQCKLTGEEFHIAKQLRRIISLRCPPESNKRKDDE